MTSSHWNDKWRPTSQVRILSIDGGGVRGIIPACGLIELERALQTKEKNRTTIYDAFDWFIGTSTGSLVAAYLALNKSPTEIRDMYREIARYIFPDFMTKVSYDPTELFLVPFRAFGMVLPKHSDSNLNKILKEIFKNATLGSIKKDTTKRLLIVTYSAGTRQPLILDSDSHAHKDVPIWEACRASSAAQTYLPEHLMKIGDGETLSLLDGGTIANNPSAIAIGQALKCRLEKQSAFVVSLGTGQNERGTSPLRKIRLGGLLPSAPSLVQIFMSGSNRTFENLADNLLGSDDNHFRFDVPLWLSRWGMDNASDAHLNALEHDARAYWSQELVRNRLKLAAEKLDGRPLPNLKALQGTWKSEFFWTPQANDFEDKGKSKQTITIEVIGDSFIRGCSLREDQYAGFFEAGVIGAKTLVGQWYNYERTRASAFALRWTSENVLDGQWIGYGDDTPLYFGPWTLRKVDVKYAEALKDVTESFKGLAWQQIGEADESHPLYAATPVNPAPDAPWVLISGGVHGDEQAGVFAVMEFTQSILPEYAGRINFVILPCINPTGFDANTLANVRKVNLNRQFGIDSTEPEVVAVEQWLHQQGRKFRMTFDLHEVAPDYQGEGFNPEDNPRECYLYETQKDLTLRIGRKLIDSLKELKPAPEVCQRATIYHDLNDRGVVAYPEANRNEIYAAGTSFDSYLNGRYTTHSFTTETPTWWSMDQRVKTQLQWLKTAMNCIVNE